MRKPIAILSVAGLLAAVAAAPAAVADSTHKCSPGQQGNPHPGFKPGSC